MQLSGSGADCAQREARCSSSTIVTFPPTEPQAQEQLNNLQKSVPAFVPLASLSTPPFDTGTDGKSDDNAN